jgi:hypothetical protein
MTLRLMNNGTWLATSSGRFAFGDTAEQAKLALERYLARRTFAANPEEITL